MYTDNRVVTDEPLNEPPQKLKEYASSMGMPSDEFVTVHIGESVHVT